MSLLGAALLLTGRPFVAGVDQGGHLGSYTKEKGNNYLAEFYILGDTLRINVTSELSNQFLSVLVYGLSAAIYLFIYLYYSQKVRDAQHSYKISRCTLNTQ